LSVCLSVYLPVTLVHPAKAIGWTKMQYGGDTGVTPTIKYKLPCLHCVSKKVPLRILSISLTNINQFFSNSFTGTLTGQFEIK